MGLVALHHLPYVGFALVAKAALCQTEGPLGRNVAAADELPELLCDISLGPRGIRRENVELIVRLSGGKPQGIVAGVTDVVLHPARKIKEEAEDFRAAANEEKVVGPVVGELVLAVVGFVGVVDDVVPAPFVDAPGHFAQTIDYGILGQPIPPALAVVDQKGDRPLADGKCAHHALGGQRLPEDKTLDHKKKPPWEKQKE